MYGRLCNRYYTDVHVQTSMAVGTHWPATCDVCGHVLPGQMRDLRRAARADGRAFSLRAVNKMFSFAAFFTARGTVCNMIRSPCDETWTNVQERKFNQRLWTSLFGLHVRCGAFIQCGGESATDLRAVQYRARANWIGPEPDSVLRSVRSLAYTVV